jgi:rhodanese-related sulfurtransferase
MQVASFLLQHGFEAVNVAGGIHAWSAQVDPSIPVY